MDKDRISDIKKMALENRHHYFYINMNEYSDCGFFDGNKFLNDAGKKLKKKADILHAFPLNGELEELFCDNITVEWMKKLRELCSIYNCLLIINNRLDIARVIEADGVFFDKCGILIKDIIDISEGLIIGTNQENFEFADYIIDNKDTFHILD